MSQMNHKLPLVKTKLKIQEIPQDFSETYDSDIAEEGFARDVHLYSNSSTPKALQLPHVLREPTYESDSFVIVPITIDDDDVSCDNMSVGEEYEGASDFQMPRAIKRMYNLKESQANPNRESIHANLPYVRERRAVSQMLFTSYSPQAKHESLTIPRLRLQIFDQLSKSTGEKKEILSELLETVQDLQDNNSPALGNCDQLLWKSREIQDVSCIELTERVYSMASERRSLDKWPNPMSAESPLNRQKQFSSESPFEQITNDISISLQAADFMHIESIWEMRNKYGKPKRSNRENVTAQISNSYRCCLLIGDEGNQSSADLITYRNFEECPEVFWQAVYATKRDFDEKIPGAFHIAVAKIINGFSKIQRNAMLLTSRIDGYARSILSSDSKLFEINGNIHYMRCSTGCTNEIFRLPAEDGIPTCPQCRNYCLPNIRLPDQTTTRYQKYLGLIQDCDCLIILGRFLALSIGGMLVSDIARSGMKIVEISECVSVAFGNALTLQANPEVEIVEVERLLGDMLYNH